MNQVAIVTALLAACASKPDPLLLAANDDVPYRAWLRTYHDGAYADQPFELFVRSKSANRATRVLSAEQCKNVSVVQTPDTLHVFYDALSLNAFNGTEPSYADQPRVRLCPRHSIDCASAQRDFERAGRRPVNVCTYQTKQSG